MMQPDYGTDSGPDCPKCSGTVYGYNVEDDTVTAKCYGCNRVSYFATDVRTAAEMSTAHRAAVLMFPGRR